jgi:putative membrane-bound dehydrogenase-like protein
LAPSLLRSRGAAALAATLLAMQPRTGDPSGIEIDPVLRVELVAAEPLVFDPVDLEFDELGRAFVLEMPGYPIVEPDQPPPGRIVVLHDDDGDGRFDRRTVFADGFRYASSLLPYRGGLLVSDAPDLLYVRDTDGDGRADVRQVVLSGFGTGPSESSFNGLRWGLDNWVYGAIGSNGGSVYFPERPDERRALRGRDFKLRFDLDTNDPNRLGKGELREAGATGDGFGLDFDVWGRRFVVDEQKHIQAEIFPDRYLPAGHTWPPTVVEISDHGRDDTARVYPISETEERPNHPEQAGYFTAGCGITYYGGGMFPAGFENSFVVAEAVHNVVHRDIVEAEGAGFVARRDRPRAEMLAARDGSFRPVNFAVGPDGALYLLDMHRAVIEHPEWIPAEMQQGIDLREGEDRGRVYRITPRAGIPPLGVRPDDLALASPARLVAWLEHPNRWWRDTAQRLLVERGGTAAAAIPELVLMARQHHDPLARLHALWALEGLGELRAGEVLAALQDDSWGLRENALRLAEALIAANPGAGRVGPALVAHLLAAGTDPAPRVRMQAFLSAGAVWDRLGGDARAAILADAASALRRDAGDPWIRLAALALAARSPVAVLESYSSRLPAADPAENLGENTDEGTTSALFGLGRLAGERAAADDLAATLKVAAGLAERAASVAAPLLEGVAEGLGNARGFGRSLPSSTELDPALAPLRDAKAERIALPAWRASRLLGWSPDESELARARDAAQRAGDDTQSVAARVLALEWIDEIGPTGTQQHEQPEQPDRATLLLDLLDARQPPELQRAALERLVRSRDAAVGRELLARWRTLGPLTRQRAADFLVYRPFNHAALLDALESGALPIGQLNLHLERRRALLRAGNPDTRRRAEAFLSDLEVATRAQAIESMRPAAALTGDIDRGREVFRELCARCHRIREKESGPDAVIGMELGPSLTDIFRRSKESLIVDIVDPNAAVDPSYLVFDVTTRDGETVSGLLLAQDEQGVTVRTADGEDRRLARDQVTEIFASGLSLMPEELETGLDHQRMADLLAFLSQPR